MNPTPRSENTSLPPLSVSYATVNVFRLTGFTAFRETSDITIDLGIPGAKALLVADPSAWLDDVDRSQAVSHIIFDRVFRGQGDALDNPDAIDAKVREYRDHRTKEFSAPGVYLIVRVEGEVQSTPVKWSRDLGSVVLATEVVDKEPLRAKAQQAVSMALGAVALANANASDVIPVQAGIVLRLPDGRLLCSPKFTGMTARLSTSRPMTSDDVAAIARRADELARAPVYHTPARLVADAIRRSKDRLESFLFAWAAVEMTVNKATSGCESGRWVDSVPTGFRERAGKFHREWVDTQRRTYSFSQKLQSIAWLHGVSDSDLKRIDTIKIDIREPMYHQAQFDEAALPVDETVQLASALLRAVLK